MSIFKKSLTVKLSTFITGKKKKRVWIRFWSTRNYDYFLQSIIVKKKKSIFNGVFSTVNNCQKKKRS